MLRTVKVYALRRFAAESRVDVEDIIRAPEPGVDGVVLEVCSTEGGVPTVCLTEERTAGGPTTAGPTETARVIELGEVLRRSTTEVLLWVRDPQVLDGAARAVEGSGAIDRASIVVEDLLHARVVRGTSSRVRVILKMGNPFPNVPLLAKEGVSALALPATVLRPRVVRECASKGLDVYAWLVNDVSQAVRTVRYGVKLLVTSRPSLKRELQQYLGVLGT